MNAAAEVAIVLSIFFALGFAVGILVVVALSARRAHRAVRPVTPPPAKWPYLPETDPDESGPDEPPWWQTRSGQ